ncbi:hypothetical protein PV325_004358 [Microctonus aethiopoides]|uniref:Myb/SANT-like DNA-binding domain-containing protein n=1 Tax=Microctonus aethiopoides TaxID=144406 RepID=A0AA39FQU0_9HYME|nr:hypothetical protein PV325_004358 [Microctonus aethiopoides]KAK0173674.1 hypothetical protein PV328_006835 [Microctonus aethiopoides]
MSDLGDNAKYKWTPESTTLLVSVWTDRQVQKQLEYTTKPQLIWESISKYMRKKGYEVTAKQCRSRMKQVLVCYKEAKKTGTHAGVERYYESIDKVLENKRIEKIKFNDNGIDTVDSRPVLLKSPPKEMKTNENLRMRHNKLEDVPISLTRHIEVYPGTWKSDREEYGDSSESNETVLARPHRSLSPMRNVGTNTVNEMTRLPGRIVRRSLPTDERFRYENVDNNRFAEIPLKTGVQNVHNQIIQENMMLRNQLAHDNIDMHQQPRDYRTNIDNPGPRLTLNPENIVFHPNRISTNMLRMQSQLQQYSLDRNTAVPQEPRKFMNMGDNTTALNGNFKQYQRAYVNTYSPDIAPNLNEAFCQTSKNTKAHNLNETYDQPMFMDNENPSPIDATTITNNATFNDDTLSIEFIENSPSPTENGGIETRTNSLDNRVTTPNAPFRKKKAQKLEQMMLNAITSQTEVFNKILATQDVMVSRILDIDKDRHNRLENRLDQLMNVVQATVMNKSSDSKESNSDPPAPPSPPPLHAPLCFSPPPRPGIPPPKLDLVPPKPCRVPTTNSSSHVEIVTQNPAQSRPGALPTKPGTIWTKLGPVSQSPFVKAQRQITAVTKAAEQWRTRSSAERRIACSADFMMDSKAIIQETEKFLQSEKLMEARIENARRLSSAPERDQSARRKLFDLEPSSKPTKPSTATKLPSAAGLLCAAFLDIERQNEEKLRHATFQILNDKVNNYDELLTGQGESYDRFRRQGIRMNPRNNIGGIVPENNMNTSTPAKTDRDNLPEIHDFNNEPRQTIQQLAELVMNSTRWRNAATHSSNNQQVPVNHFPSDNRQDAIPTRPPRETEAQRQSRNKAADWLQDPYSYGMVKPQYNEPNGKSNNHPIGFTIVNDDPHDDNLNKQTVGHPIGFTKDFIPQYAYAKKMEILNDEKRMHQYLLMAEKGVSAMQRDLIDKNAQDRKNRQLGTKNDDDNDDDEFLDTTTTLHPERKSSLTSSGTSTATGNVLKSGAPTCVIS